MQQVVLGRHGHLVCLDRGGVTVHDDLAFGAELVAEHDLLHALPRLRAALVHADPQAGPGPDLHEVLASHR